MVADLEYRWNQSAQRTRVLECVCLENTSVGRRRFLLEIVRSLPFNFLA